MSGSPFRSGSPSGEAFESLLRWLAEDRDQAAEKYEAIRAKLIKIFVCRRCAAPEDLADETIDRVIRRVSEIAQGYVGKPEHYFIRVAQFVFFEYRRQRHSFEVPAFEPEEDREARSVCLDQCLERLPTEDRDLILAYYQDEGGRKIERRRALAEGLGIAPNALRIRQHRIRNTLRSCMSQCLERTT